MRLTYAYIGQGAINAPYVMSSSSLLFSLGEELALREKMPEEEEEEA